MHTLPRVRNLEWKKSILMDPITHGIPSLLRPKNLHRPHPLHRGGLLFHLP